MSLLNYMYFQNFEEIIRRTISLRQPQPPHVETEAMPNQSVPPDVSVPTSNFTHGNSVRHTPVVAKPPLPQMAMPDDKDSNYLESLITQRDESGESDSLSQSQDKLNEYQRAVLESDANSKSDTREEYNERRSHDEHTEPVMKRPKRDFPTADLFDESGHRRTTVIDNPLVLTTSSSLIEDKDCEGDGHDIYQTNHGYVRMETDRTHYNQIPTKHRSSQYKQTQPSNLWTQFGEPAAQRSAYLEQVNPALRLANPVPPRSAQSSSNSSAYLYPSSEDTVPSFDRETQRVFQKEDVHQSAFCDVPYTSIHTQSELFHQQNHGPQYNSSASPVQSSRIPGIASIVPQLRRKPWLNYPVHDQETYPVHHSVNQQQSQQFSFQQPIASNHNGWCISIGFF